MIGNSDSEKFTIALVVMIGGVLALILLAFVAYDSETKYQKCLEVNSQDDCFVLLQ